MFDVRNMSYMTKQSIGFVCHPLFKSCSWHRTEIYDNVLSSCYVEIWSATAVCQGICRSFWMGCNIVQIICCVYLYGGSCMTCCNVCVRNSDLLLHDQEK